jgi:hypothetical protein
MAFGSLAANDESARKAGEIMLDCDVFSRKAASRNAFREVGVARGHCMLTELRGQESGSYECDVTFDLEEGDIAIEGGFAFTAQDLEAEFAVVGGTGAYKTADGTLKVTADAEGLLFLFKLIL